MASRNPDYSQLWADIGEEYRALRPRLAALRAPGANYMQVEAGGKSAHYEWKVLHAPISHVEVALHFESESRETNQAALLEIQDRIAAERAVTTSHEISGPWSSKWARYGVRVPFEAVPSRERAKQSASMMRNLIERTYPAAKALLEEASAIGWPAA